jgi:hypothetical protein
MFVSGRQLFWGAVLLGAGAWLFQKKLWLPPMGGVKAERIDLAREPEQAVIEPPEVFQIVRDDQVFIVHKISDFDISGEVLSTAAYDALFTSAYSDVDIGLLWGAQREAYKNKYDFRQSGRWLFWRSSTDVSADDRADITRHIANIHTIPRGNSKRVSRALRYIDVGDHIRLRGALVEIRSPQGELLQKSSMTRDDVGDGACELMWVDEVQIGAKLYH